jgi:hypothetical protein
VRTPVEYSQYFEVRRIFSGQVFKGTHGVLIPVLAGYSPGTRAGTWQRTGSPTSMNIWLPSYSHTHRCSSARYSDGCAVAHASRSSCTTVRARTRGALAGYSQGANGVLPGCWHVSPLRCDVASRVATCCVDHAARSNVRRCVATRHVATRHETTCCAPWQTAAIRHAARARTRARKSKSNHARTEGAYQPQERATTLARANVRTGI